MGISEDGKISTSKCRSLSNINSLGRRQIGESLSEKEKKTTAQGWSKLKEQLENENRYRTADNSRALCKSSIFAR